jgi:uncharacterized protein YigE (DUF2233 family)
MKRVFFVVVVACIAVLVWIAYQFMNINLDQVAPITKRDPTPTLAATKPDAGIRVNNESYAYSLVRVAIASNITLIPNFTDKTDAKTLADANGCRQAISGGFYDKAGKPLGFFFADNRTLGQEIHSTLLNGFFWADTAGSALISTALPDIPYRFALQTGPLLLFNGQTMPLTIENDEHARRMVVGKTTNNQFIFLAVYSGESAYFGPLLSGLPSVVSSISSKDNLGIEDALNLDGGSASAFYSGDTRLSELTPVGSLFCVK